jgi:hypothetical protein
MLASRADTGEVLHVRLRKGQATSPRGVVRFVDELMARVARAGGHRREAVAGRPGVLEEQVDSAARAHRLVLLDRRAHAVLGQGCGCSYPAVRVAAPGADYPLKGEAQIAKASSKTNG